MIKQSALETLHTSDFRSVAVGYAEIHGERERVSERVSESGLRVARYQKIEYTHFKFALLPRCSFSLFV